MMNQMVKWRRGLIVLGVIAPLLLQGLVAQERSVQNGFGIVPMPYEVQAIAGQGFRVNSETAIVAEGDGSQACAAYLDERFRLSTGLKLKSESKASRNAITLRVSQDATSFSEKDAYRLESNADGVTISAKTDQGLFYGVQTLLQLLPPAVYGDRAEAGLELELPALVINDKPSMDKIRGLHVDIARHFRSKEELVKIIDSMAMHKLNTLHLHLTDTQAWRVEIKAFPKLTTIGAIGNNTDPEASAKFLTQEDVLEICAYAKSRFVTVIPEIDMPGHMGAAIRAYPELNHPGDVKGKKFAIRNDVVGRDFAKAVLREVSALFDSEYIHIGVDEVNFGAKVKLYTDAEVLDFTKDLTGFVKHELKKTPIVWDDAFTHGFSDKGTLVHWWRYGKKYWWKRMEYTVDEALNRQQQPFILSPAYWTYFDMRNTQKSKGARWAQALSAAEVYNWDPLGDMLGVTSETRQLVQGAIACTWSEQIPTMRDFGDRTYPRLASFSERIWRGGKLEAPEILEWPEYRDQVLVPFQLKRYEAMGLHYWSKGNPELLRILPNASKKL